MKEIYDFIKACPCYFIVTMDGNQSRVRPFGTICSFTSAPKEFCF